MARENLDLGDLIQKGLELYKDNLTLLLLVHLLAMLLSAVSLGIVAGPIFAGVFLITLRLVDRAEPQPQIGDVFDGFRLFANAFLFFFIWTIINLFGSSILSILGPVFSLVLGTFLMFGLFLVADREMAFWPASAESFNKVKQNFWPLLGLNALASVLAIVGFVACGIGLVFTLPIYTCIIAVTYRQFYPSPASVAVEAEPPAEDTPGGE